MRVDRRQDHELEHDREHGRPRRRHGGHDEFFGLDVQKMSPKAQVTAGLAVLIPVAVAGLLVITLVPWLWWLVFVFGWTIFPAFGLLVRGIAGLSDGPTELPSGGAAAAGRVDAGPRGNGDVADGGGGGQDAQGTGRRRAPGGSRARWGSLLFSLGARRRGRRAGDRGQGLGGYAEKRAWYHFYSKDG
jgi:hypothetical protein